MNDNIKTIQDALDTIPNGWRTIIKSEALAALPKLTDTEALIEKLEGMRFTNPTRWGEGFNGALSDILNHLSGDKS